MMNLIRNNYERDLFDIFFGPDFSRTKMTTMPTDIKENEKEYQLEIRLAGYNKDEIKLSFENGYLTVQASKNENNDDENANYIRKEIYYGSQSRSYYVGNIDQNLINASFENGILKVGLPKEELIEEDDAKYIDIK